MNTKLRQKGKNNFERNLFNLLNNVVFGKTMENMRKQKNINLITAEMKRNYLVSEPNYHTRNFFTETLLAIEIGETQILINKAVYLGLLILDRSK